MTCYEYIILHNELEANINQLQADVVAHNNAIAKLVALSRSLALANEKLSRKMVGVLLQ